MLKKREFFEILLITSIIVFFSFFSLNFPQNFHTNNFHTLQSHALLNLKLYLSLQQGIVFNDLQFYNGAYFSTNIYMAYPLMLS